MKGGDMGGFLQVFIAIILVIVFFIIGFATYNMGLVNSLRASNKVHITTPIFTGIQDYHSYGGQTYNTLDSSNPLDPTYRNLGNAMNQAAGAEFAYNFWLYLDPTGVNAVTANTPATIFSTLPLNSSCVSQTTTTQTKAGTFSTDFGLNVDQFILFVRGTNTASTYNSLCGQFKKKQDVMVKCPLVKLEKACDVLTVEFNTLTNPDAVMAQSRNTCSDVSTDWDYMNSYKLGIKNLKATYPNQWFMVTVVIMDTYPSDPLSLRDKCRCQIYINGAVQLDQYVDGKLNAPSSTPDSVLRQNLGNLYVAPAIKFKQEACSTSSSSNSTVITPLGSTTTPVVMSLTDNKTINQQKAVMMADLTYMNYIPTTSQLQTLYSTGITQSYAPMVAQQDQSKSGSLAVAATNFMSQKSGNVQPNAVEPIYTL